MSRHLRLLGFALSSLLENRTKTLGVVTVYALLVGLAASLLLFVGSLRREARQLLGTAPEIVVQRLQGGRHAPMPSGRAEAVRGIRGVAAVTPRVWGYSYDPPSGVTYTFWGAESVPPEALEVIDGGLLDDGDPRTCIVGQGVAEARLLWLGDRFPIRGGDGTLFAPRVVGIFTAASSLLTHDLVVLPTAQLRRIFALEADEATDLAVAVTNPREVDTVARKIQETWPDVRTVTRRQILQTWDAAFDWRGGVWAAALLVAAAAFGLLVWDQASGLSAEEHRNLGILKAVGWSPKNVLELELFKGVAVSLTAVVTGLLLAQVHLVCFGGALFARVLQGWSVVFPAFDLSPGLDLHTLGLCLLLAVVPYVAASLVPAWRAAVTDPDTLLRA